MCCMHDFYADVLHFAHGINLVLTKNDYLCGAFKNSILQTQQKLNL